MGDLSEFVKLWKAKGCLSKRDLTIAELCERIWLDYRYSNETKLKLSVN